ncbi:hypothetical protein AB4122_09725 [Vibrio cyclitrophicus]
MPLDIFSEINNAVLDLQSSLLQTFARPLQKLANLLQHPELSYYNAMLTESVDLDAFLTASEKTGGGMVGSAELIWPDNRRNSWGLHAY